MKLAMKVKGDKDELKGISPGFAKVSEMIAKKVGSSKPSNDIKKKKLVLK